MCTKEITINEMFNLMGHFQGRQIEVDLSPIQSANTYHWFSFNEIDDAIEFRDRDNNHPQLFRFFKNDILNILYKEGKNLFESLFTINLESNIQIKVSVYEEPENCDICGKIINWNYDDYIWVVNATGGYGSHFDSEKLSMKICDDCMYGIVNSERFGDLDE